MTLKNVSIDLRLWAFNALNKTGWYIGSSVYLNVWWIQLNWKNNNSGVKVGFCQSQYR